MFYKQNVDNIKLVILSLDGGLLDLNRLRYNYLKKICKMHNIKITKEEFEKSLGNMDTMYINLPIANEIAPDDLNKLIERDLYEYAKLKPNSLIKEGAEDLLQFFRQKNIKVAVISTHKIKRAIQYLQLTRLYNYVDFIIGGDHDHLPLPDPSILTITLEQLNVNPKNALVVANFPSLLYGANRKFMNVVYVCDLCPATNSILSSAFRVAKNNLDIINIFLFARYDTMEMYSPLLGMSSDMSLQALKATYQRLLNEYQNDQQLIDLVNETYQYFLNEILESDSATIIPTLFEDDEPKVADSNKEDKKAEVPLPQKPSKHFEFSDNQQPLNTTKQYTKEDPEHINELMDIINGTSNLNKKSDNTAKEKKDKDNNKDKIKTDKFDKIINFLYTLVIVAFVSFGGLLAYVAFEDYLYGPSIIAGIIKNIIDFYVNAVISIYSLIFNCLHAIIGFIPDYQHLIANNSFLSSLAIQLFLFIVFNLLIVYIFKFGNKLINKLEDDDEFN